MDSQPGDPVAFSDRPWRGGCGGGSGDQGRRRMRGRWRQSRQGDYQAQSRRPSVQRLVSAAVWLMAGPQSEFGQVFSNPRWKSHRCRGWVDPHLSESTPVTAAPRTATTTIIAMMWLFGGRGFGLLWTLALVHQLGIGDYGLYGMALAVTMIVGPSLDNPFAVRAIRE